MVVRWLIVAEALCRNKRSGSSVDRGLDSSPMHVRDEAALATFQPSYVKERLPERVAVQVSRLATAGIAYA